MSKTAPRNSGGCVAFHLSVLAVGAVLALTSCAGEIDGTATASSGEGFEYGASQNEVDAIVEDLEPVTIKFQSSAASPTSLRAPEAELFKELVEERSNGKITVENVWGQAIAGFGEVDDALADGRLDIAYNVTSYQPDELRAVNDLNTATGGLSTSPFHGELVVNAVARDLAWKNESILEQYAAKSVIPLTPLEPSASYYAACNTPVKSAEDWKGLQVRVGSTAHNDLISHLGGTPVSMEYTETFDALQRGTIDCTYEPLASVVESGAIEVAPHLGYIPDAGAPRVGQAYLAGSNFANMPLAYQQIIFDSNAMASAARVSFIAEANATAFSLAVEHGGGVTAFGEEVQEQSTEFYEQLTSDATSRGEIDADIQSEIPNAMDTWGQRIEELGYVDEGHVEDFVSWYTSDDDFSDYARVTYENSEALNYRPE